MLHEIEATVVLSNNPSFDMLSSLWRNFSVHKQTDTILNDGITKPPLFLYFMKSFCDTILSLTKASKHFKHLIFFSSF